MFLCVYLCVHPCLSICFFTSYLFPYLLHPYSYLYPLFTFWSFSTLIPQKQYETFWDSYPSVFSLELGVVGMWRKWLGFGLRGINKAKKLAGLSHILSFRGKSSLFLDKIKTNTQSYWEGKGRKARGPQAEEIDFKLQTSFFLLLPS